MTQWQRTQYRRLLALLDYAETLPDREKRQLGSRLIVLTEAVDVLIGRPRNGGSHHHIANVIGELERKHIQATV